MAGISIDRFFGIVPREHPANLPPGYAEVAHDARLNDGTLRPWRELLPVENADDSNLTVYQWGCCWYHWDACVEVAEWKPNCPRLYVTGSAPWPVVSALGDDCQLAGWARVGVPEPAGTPVTTALTARENSDSVKAVAYLYTYANQFCEEGPPSYPSNEVVYNDGGSCLITNIAVPEPEWGVTEVNIYRRETGAITGREEVEPAVTDYFLVATIPVGSTSYVDALPTTAIGRALPTREFRPPPADLRGIITVFAGNTMAGHIGNQLWFCNAGQPWNWPEAQMMTLDDNIVSIASTNDGVLHVVTDGTPYAIVAEANCAERECRKVVRHVEKLPGVVCCSNRGVVMTPGGTVYVSADGLVLLQGTRPPVILTSPWYATEGWRQLTPETMRLGYYAGAVFCVSDTYGFVLTMDDTTHVKWDTLRLSTISDRPKTMVLGRNGEMFMHFDTVISQWDAGVSLRPYKWQSRLIESATYLSMSSGRLQIDGFTDLTVLASQREVFKRTVMGGASFRLKPYGHHLMHGVRLEGTARVWRVHLATSMMDLKESAKNN